MEEKKHCKWYNDEFCTNGDSPCVADYCPVVEYPELCKCREIDEDINVPNKKELTDENLVTYMEYCTQHSCSEDCPMCKVQGCMLIMLKQSLDLIHRLQDENAKQKAEIERLTEEREDIRLFQLSLQNGEIDMTIESPMAKSFYDCIVQIFEQNGAKNFFTTTVELENQNGKYAFTIEKTGGITVAERIAELKKQVDELTAKLQCPTDITEAVKPFVSQAVKNTAKKYHDAVKELFNKWDCCGYVEDRSSEEWYKDNDKIAREQFGVEVE